MRAYGVSDIGNFYSENQDAILIQVFNQSGIFIVADGVGGSFDGSIASRMIVETYGRWWEEYFLHNQAISFVEAFEEIKTQADDINKALCRLYGEGICCSTMVLLFVHDSKYGYISIGDSRLYLCDKKAKRITRDDTWDNLPGNEGMLLHAGKIVSAVGGFEHLDFSCATDSVGKGESFLLCSDGIYKIIKDRVIFRYLKWIRMKPSLRSDDMKYVINKVEKNGANDNYSLIIVKI